MKGHQPSCLMRTQAERSWMQVLLPVGRSPHNRAHYGKCRLLRRHPGTGMAGDDAALQKSFKGQQ